MKKPAFKPGIGVYSWKDEIHIELYPVKKRLEFTADTTGKKVITLLNGQRSLQDILLEIQENNQRYTLEQLSNLISQLDQLNLIYDADTYPDEPTCLSRQIDYFNMYPSPIKDITQFMDTLDNLRVTIIGCGGLGTAIFEELVRCGITRITIVDDDVIERNNLSNQSVYTLKDVGHLKVEVLKHFAEQLNPNSTISSLSDKVTKENIDELTKKSHFVFSCADTPSVDELSKTVSESCFKFKVPHIVGGGYAGHRAALGMFIIPYQTLCWDCYLQSDASGDAHKQELISPKNRMSFYPLIAMVASIQVGEFFRHYTERKHYVLTNTFSELSFDTMTISHRKFAQSSHCLKCSQLQAKS